LSSGHHAGSSQLLGDAGGGVVKKDRSSSIRAGSKWSAFVSKGSAFADPASDVDADHGSGERIR
jgi:hypothetical protein